MTLPLLRTAIIDSISSNMSTFRTVQAHGGRFNREELMRLATKAPAALVAIMGGPIERDSTQAVGVVTVVVFILTRGTSEIKRDEAALVLAESLAGLANENKWSYDDAQAPMNMRMDNLYSGTIDRDGIALWSVSWTQKTNLAVYDPTNLDEFHTLYTDYDLAPADGVFELQQVIQVWGELMASYGHIYISTSASTSIAAADTFQKLNGTTTLKESLTCDMPENNRLRHTGTVVKPFMVSASVSVTVGADAKVSIALAEGGVVDANTAVEQEVTLAGGAETISTKGIFNLDENEYVEIWVTDDTGVVVTATKATLVMVGT